MSVFRSCSGPYFSAFRLNAERCGVSLSIHFECWKIRTRKTQNMDTFWNIPPFLVGMRENTDQKKSKYGHFSQCTFSTQCKLSFNKCKKQSLEIVLEK